MGPGQGAGWLGLADPNPLCPQRPTDEESFLPPPGEKSSENYQIVKGVSGGGHGGRVCLPGGFWGLASSSLPPALLATGPNSRHLPAFLESAKQPCQGPDGIILELKEFNEIPFHSHIVLLAFTGGIGFSCSPALFWRSDSGATAPPPSCPPPPCGLGPGCVGLGAGEAGGGGRELWALRSAPRSWSA